ncbi:cytochrome c-type biogenesis protein [Thioalkalivibrio sp. HK1]|uniref:cytochrome c-type biogenesis protein n=1 Tax=Thioalkalivibrio sp. HK1 TaxID=1469245 RepID=UPI00046ED4E2|nr:cytochrome c-type biogenesis protein [Thioalkalivibrio sp. HK1]
MSASNAHPFGLKGPRAFGAGSILFEIVAILAFALFGAGPVIATQGDLFEPRDFSFPAHEERYLRMINSLRCLVCQNQTIAESDADLATDLRREVHRMIEQGRSDEEIADFMTARFGEFVLYRPRLRSDTILLWFGPFLFVGAGLVLLVLRLRKRKDALRWSTSGSVRKRARRLLEEGGVRKKT